MTRVCVLGAGAVGCASAMCLLEGVPGLQVTLMAERFPPDTTSDVAGGYWFPHALRDTPVHLIRRWGKATRDFLIGLMEQDCVNTGVQLLSGYMLEDNETANDFSDLLLHWSKMNSSESALFPHHPHPHRYMVTTLMCEGAIYTPWLLSRVKALGTTIVQKKVQNLEELYSDYDIVVNCCGPGAVDLMQDEEMQVQRGQVIKVEAPWVKHFCGVNDGQYYIIPGQRSVTLGGTHQKNDWQLRIRPSDTEDIMQGCCKLVPSLKDARVITQAVGLRPCRTMVRLEEKNINYQGRTIQVIHNYGHGGAGLTLHYGCALDVTAMVKNRHNKAKL